MSVIRPATANDVPAILQMIHDLAIYEKEPDAVRNTPELLGEVLFGKDPRVFAAMAENESGDVRGFALWFLNYSTWEGVHGIYLEDLYVRPEARGEGQQRLARAGRCDDERVLPGGDRRPRAHLGRRRRLERAGEPRAGRGGEAVERGRGRTHRAILTRYAARGSPAVHSGRVRVALDP